MTDPCAAVEGAFRKLVIEQLVYWEEDPVLSPYEEKLVELASKHGDISPTAAASRILDERDEAIAGGTE